MGNKTFAFAMALIMALSGFTAVAAVSDESDAASAVQLEKGDAWGAGGHMDLGILLKAINDELKNQDIVLEVPLEKEALLDYIEGMINGLPTGYEVSDLDFDISGDAWNIAEVVQKNASGYVIEFVSATAVQMSAAGKVTGQLPASFGDIDFDGIEDGDLPGLDDLDTVHATLNLKSLVLSANSLIEGKIYLDPECDLTRMDVSVNVGITSSFESNVKIDSDGRISYGTETEKMKFVAGCDLDGSISTIGDAIKFLPDSDGKGWTQETEVNVSVHGNVYADLPGDLEDISEGFNESDTEEIEFEVFCTKESDGTYRMTMTTVDMDIPNELDFPLEYVYPFENAEVPEFILVGDSLRLDSGEKKTVRNNIKEISGDFADAMADTDCTVRFVDDDGRFIDELTQTVKYGKTIVLPDYPSTSPRDDDDVFIGWETYNDVIWKNEYPVKYNMVLEAEFADKVSDVPGADDFITNPSVFWETTVDKVTEALDNSMFADGNTLYISISDADNNVLYKWKIGTGSAGETVTGSVVPEIQKLETPAKDYLKEAAGGNSTVYLDFKASGTMPSKTVVSYYVGDVFQDGDSVTIYYDNEKMGSAVNSGSAVVIDGYVDIPLKHCSSYMLVSEGSAGSSDGSSDGSGTMVVIAVSVVLAAIVAILIVRKVKGSA